MWNDSFDKSFRVLKTLYYLSCNINIFFLKFVNKKSNQEDLNYEKSHKQYQLKILTKYSVFDIIVEKLFIYLSNEYRPSREHFPQIGLQNLTYVRCSEGSFACHAFIRFQGHLQGPVTRTPNADRLEEDSLFS